MEREQRLPDDDLNVRRALHYPTSALPCGISLYDIQDLWMTGQAIPFKGDRAPYIIATYPDGTKKKIPAFCKKVPEGK